jgi:hypothetical protein
VAASSGTTSRNFAVPRRIVCQLVDEAYFAIGEGVGSGEDVDAG